MIAEKMIQTRTRRQRDALHAGIADVPLPDPDEIMDRFNRRRAGKTHTAMMRLLHDLQRIQRRPARRPLPGIVLVS